MLVCIITLQVQFQFVGFFSSFWEKQRLGKSPFLLALSREAAFSSLLWGIRQIFLQKKCCWLYFHYFGFLFQFFRLWKQNFWEVGKTLGIYPFKQCQLNNFGSWAQNLKVKNQLTKLSTKSASKTLLFVIFLCEYESVVVFFVGALEQLHEVKSIPQIWNFYEFLLQKRWSLFGLLVELIYVVRSCRRVSWLRLTYVCFHLLRFSVSIFFVSFWLVYQLLLQVYLVLKSSLLFGRFWGTSLFFELPGDLDSLVFSCSFMQESFSARKSN